MRRMAMLVLTLLLMAGSAQAELRVLNIQSGAELRYPVALLAGEADAGAAVTVVDADNDTVDGRNEVGVFSGRFRVLVRLVPGLNHLQLSAGADSLPLELTYTPMTNPRRVSVVYLTGSEGETTYPTQVEGDPQDYEAKLRTAADLIQTFTAEALNEQGYGRKTFSLERDGEGQVIVHTLRLPDTAEEIRSRDPGEQWQRSARAIGEQFDYGMVKVLALNGFVLYDAASKKALGHTALGGGSLAVFSSNSLCAWPGSIHDVQRAFLDDTPVDEGKLWDDTAGRGTLWALVSTGIGAWLHELGHTLGLPHSPDPRAIMNRGIDRLNRSFVPVEAPHRGRREPYVFSQEETARWDTLFAPRLALNPWLQPDGVSESGKPGPRARLDWATDRLIIEAPAGLALVQYESGAKRVSHPQSDPTQTELQVSHAELKQEMEAAEGVEVTAVDREGRVAQYDTKNARNPEWYIRTWRLSPEPIAWTSMPDPRPLSADEVLALVEELSTRPEETWTPEPYAQQYSFDLNAKYGYHGDCLAYALHILQADAERQVTLLAGGDDGVRVWVNNELVLDASGVHVVPVDGKEAAITLRPGSNTLLVESQQGPGDWQFSVRLREL